MLLVALFGGAQALPEAGGLTPALYYLACTFLIVGLPTAAMGATLPLLARHAVERQSQIGSRVGLLYATWHYNLKSPRIFPGVELALNALNPWRLALLFFISGVACRFLLEKLGPDDIDYSPFTDRRWLLLPSNESPFDGEGVLFWGTSTLNFKNGVSSSFPIHIVTIVKDGQIISMYFYYNILKIQKDLGYTISPP